MGRDRSRSGGRRERDRSRDRRDRSRDRRPSDRDGKGSRKEEEKREPEDDKFAVGRTVIVKGLQKNPEKNGSMGKLTEFITDKGRWAVELSAGKHNFKEENLELMPDNSDFDDKSEPPTAKIYITGLAADITDKDLIQLFGGVGLIAKETPKSSRDRGFEDQWPFAVKLYKPGRSNGDACVTYMDPHAAKAAIKTYNRYKLKGTKITVAYAGQGRKYEEVELQLPWHMREENQGKLDREADSKGGGGGGKGERRPGDWTCGGCGANNYASRDTCFKCGGLKKDAK
jgi:RNA-binding protein FUS